MIECNRCQSKISIQGGSFWSEPVLACSSCGARHQRESRLERGLQIIIILPLLLAVIAGWILSLYFVDFMIAIGIFSWKLIALLLASIGLNIWMTYHGITAFKSTTQPREIMCNEK